IPGAGAVGTPPSGKPSGGNTGGVDLIAKALDDLGKLSNEDLAKIGISREFVDQVKDLLQGWQKKGDPVVVPPAGGNGGPSSGTPQTGAGTTGPGGGAPFGSGLSDHEAAPRGDGVGTQPSEPSGGIIGTGQAGAEPSGTSGGGGQV